MCAAVEIVAMSFAALVVITFVACIVLAFYKFWRDE